MRFEKTGIIKAVLFLLIGIISFFVLAHFASSTEFHANSIQTIDEKRNTVMELAAGTTAASTAISMIPGDAGTPIADKLADFSSYFLIVLTAIFLEKYLLTVTGLVAFKFLIPIGCLLLAVYNLWGKETLAAIAKKMIVFGLAIALIIPASVKVSNMIEATYHESIQESIDAAKDAANVAKDAKDKEEKAENADDKKAGAASADKKQSTQDRNPGGVSGLWDTLTDKAEEAVVSITDTASDAVDKAKTALNRVIEALAIMMVTSCVIPILVILFFVWICNRVLDVNISVNRLTTSSKKRKPSNTDED